jgi:trigger factor
MNYKIENLPKSEIKIQVSITKTEFQKFLDEAIKNIGKDIEISGFRKGTAPLELIKKQLTQDQYNLAIDQAIDNAIQKNYRDIIEKEKLDILGRPRAESVNLKEDFSLDFEILAATFPEISLPDLKEIIQSLKKREIKVEDQEIESALQWLRKSRAKFIFKNTPAENGDWVEIEYQSKQIEDNRTFEDKFILGQGNFVPGFEKEIVGMKVNSEKEFSIVFPEDYHKKDLGGLKVEFKLKLKNVQKMELPELTDDWAQSLGDFKNLDALKNSIKEGLYQEKEMIEKNRLREEMLEKIREKTKIEVPEILVKEMQERLLTELKEKITHQFNLDFNTYLAQIKKTEEEIKNSFKELAEKRVANSLILQEIIKKEEIQATPEEIEEKVNEFLNKSYNVTRLGEIDLDQIKAYYKNEIETEKAFQFLESFLKN